MYNVNNLQQVNLLLKQLNTAINVMYKLDDEYYRGDIFNASTDIIEQTAIMDFVQIGIDLERVRNILYGEHVINWTDVEKNLDKTCVKNQKRIRADFDFKLGEYFKNGKISFAEKMQEFGITDIKNTVELLKKYKYIRADRQKKLDCWLLQDVKFFGIEEIAVMW